jgi:hypothetical protein
MTTPEDQPTASSPAAASDPIAHALDFALYAPIGAAALFVDVAPEILRTVVARGRAEVEVRHEQVSGRIRHAKGAGEVAVAFGVPMLRRKIEARLASLRANGDAAPPAQPAAATLPAAATVPSAVSVTIDDTVATNNVNGNGRHGDSDALAIPGYDALSASQVVERLAGLSGAELAAVREYEAGHRRRRTILGKIEQLSV